MSEAQRNFNFDKNKVINKNDTDFFKKLGSKIPPHNIEAEISVLGAMMLSKEGISKIVGIISEESFYLETHKIIFRSMIAMDEASKNVDILTLADYLRSTDNLSVVGGAEYLAFLNNSTPTAANIEQYSLIVQEKFLKRSLITIAGEVLNNAYDETKDAIEEIDKAEQEIFHLAEKRFIKGYKNMKSLVMSTFTQIEELSSRDKSKLSGVPTGITKLDNMLGGFQKSDLVIIAARPSMGKTALAMTFARNAAMQFNKPVAVFSIEMASNQLVTRLLSAEAKINQQKLRTGHINNQEMKNLIKACGSLQEAPLFIDDTSMLSILEFRAKCRRLKTEHKIEMVIVDYLQLMHAPKSDNREREIAIISSTLKQVAKELEIPVIALAQLNRSVDGRTDKRPMLSDLRESGSIEQDADVVMFVNRPEVYGQKFWDKENTMPTENTAEIIIGKQRNGPIGDVKVTFLKDFARFENHIDSGEMPENLSRNLDAYSKDEPAF